MNKWLGVLIVIVLLVVAWFVTGKYVRFTPEWDKPKFEKITRGDIRVPITAAGLIEPHERIEIKPEASGEVLEVRVQPGDSVKPGDVLVVIKKDDEERNVERARASLDRARAAFEQAKIAVLKAHENVLTAEARIDELQANGDRLQIDLDKVEDMFKAQRESERAVRIARAAVAANNAQIRAAQAALEVARQSKPEAEQAVIIQEAAVRDAMSTLKDAETRLERTTVVAKIDALITEVRVKPGNVVQSGTQGFTGGSILLYMADLTTLKVLTRVDEADYGRVSEVAPPEALPSVFDLRESAAREDAEKLARRSGKVKITVDAFPNDEFEGVIERVEPQGKLNSGSSVIQFDVHVQITDPKKSKLPLGTQAQVEFTVESVSDSLLVPADAVKTEQGEKGVWVKGDLDARGEPKPRFVPCRFGITDGSNTQLIAAIGGVELKEGMEVYTKLPVNRDEEKRR